jgi:sec-independent protein translocase protein TatA
MFANMGMTEILIILFVLLLLFGGKKLPELAKGVGKGIRNFKNEVKEVKDELDVTKDIKKITDINN